MYIHVVVAVAVFVVIAGVVVGIDYCCGATIAM